MNVLIFGGTGFVGRNLTRELLENGYQVYIVTRNAQRTAGTLAGGVGVIEWDNVSPLASLKNLAQIEAVINLAGESIGNRRWTPSVKEEIIASRLRTTGAIATAINEGVLRPEVLINASAVGYYGPRGDEEITESEEPGKDFLAQVCQKWEEEAYKVQDSSTRVVTPRLGVVLGNEGALNRMALPFKFYLGGPLGTGEQWLSWIHSQDLVSMIRFIIEHPELSGPINAVAPNPAKMRDFSKTLGKALHKPSWFPVPEILLKIALGQMAEMLLHGQRAVPKQMRQAGFAYRYGNLQEALANALL